MSRMGAIFLFLFIFNATLVLLDTIGISIGAVSTSLLLSSAQMLSMTATTTWYNATILSLLGPLGYFVIAAEMLVFAVILFMQTIYMMTVGAAAFYGALFALVVGAGVVTTAFTAFFTLISNYITLMGMLEIIGGKDTGT